MLTECEQKWLKYREGLGFHLYCLLWCTLPNGSDECFCICASGQCPLSPREEMLKDALEFSERVAAKLAITGDVWDFEDMPCRGERQYMISKCPLRKNHWECADCYIKAARLKVEEEMDENNTMSLPN